MRFTVIFRRKVCVIRQLSQDLIEGAGEMFKVTALPFDGTPRTEDGKVNYKEDFFGKRQTYGFWTTGRRNFMALGQIYTFGPTFRAS
jgi:asparaginyl-tRNA synthetase